MSAPPSETLLEFPCEFPIKAFGHADPGLAHHVLEIIRRHAPETGEERLSLRSSKTGKYDAVTVTITAQSKAQLDAIYLDLTASSIVIMAL
jgi:putative lipoic acid-binding regulatory protein